MAKHLTDIAILILAVAVFFFLGVGLAKALQKRFKPRDRRAAPEEMPMSAFSTFDHPAMRDQQSDPLREAAVYMIYRKRKEAERVLKQAVRAGRITATQAADFWTQQAAAEGTPQAPEQ